MKLTLGLNGNSGQALATRVYDIVQQALPPETRLDWRIRTSSEIGGRSDTQWYKVISKERYVLRIDYDGRRLTVETNVVPRDALTARLQLN